QTSQAAIYDVLGLDAFTATGLDNVQNPDARMVMLDTQRRMDRTICELISGPMYGGLLKTGDRKSWPRKPPAPYESTLTIIDTSDLWPFESVNAYFSRFNIMHALLARNLAWYFRREGYLQSEKDLAVCTPYSAQSRLIKKLLDGDGLGGLVQVGTVHSFQG